MMIKKVISPTRTHLSGKGVTLKPGFGEKTFQKFICLLNIYTCSDFRAQEIFRKGRPFVPRKNHKSKLRNSWMKKMKYMIWTFEFLSYLNVANYQSEPAYCFSVGSSNIFRNKSMLICSLVV